MFWNFEFWTKQFLQEFHLILFQQQSYWGNLLVSTQVAVEVGDDVLGVDALLEELQVVISDCAENVPVVASFAAHRVELVGV